MELTDKSGHGTMWDRGCEVDQHSVPGDMNILGIDDAELLERDWMFRIGYRTKEVCIAAI